MAYKEVPTVDMDDLFDLFNSKQQKEYFEDHITDHLTLREAMDQYSDEDIDKEFTELLHGHTAENIWDMMTGNQQDQLAKYLGFEI